MDRWSMALLLTGNRPTCDDRESFSTYFIGEREYLAFVGAQVEANTQPMILRLAETVCDVTGPSSKRSSAFPIALDASQVSELYDIEFSILRLETELLGHLPVATDAYGLRPDEAESLLLAQMYALPLLTCFKALRPAFWKALYHSSILKLDLVHTCPELSTPKTWFRP